MDRSKYGLKGNQMTPEETFKTKQDIETIKALRSHLVSAHTLIDTLATRGAQRDVYAILYKVDEALLWSRKYQEDLQDKLATKVKANES